MIAFYTTLMIVATLILVVLAIQRPGGPRQARWHALRVVLLGSTVFAAVMLMIDGAAPVFPDADSSLPASVSVDSAAVADATPAGVGDAGSLAVS